MTSGAGKDLDDSAAAFAQEDEEDAKSDDLDFDLYAKAEKPHAAEEVTSSQQRSQLRPEVHQILQQLQNAATAAAVLPVEAASAPPLQSQHHEQESQEREQQQHSSPVGGRYMGWRRWSADDVGDWVDSLLGSGNGHVFRQRQVDGPTLVALTGQDFAEGLGIADPLHRAKLLGHLQVMTGRAEAMPADDPQEVQKDLDKRQLLPEEALDAVGVGGESQHPGSEDALADAVQLLDNARQEMLEARWRTDNARSRRLPPGNRPLSRSQTTAQTISAGYPSNFAAASSRYSGYLGAARSPGSVVGLSSLIGLDSPSNSLRGSFSGAPARPGLDRMSRRAAESPGPGTYEAANAERAQGKNMSPPRPTIGTSTRQPLRRIEPGGPGPQSYNISVNSLMKPTSPRPTIGTSSKGRRWDADIGGCPTFYSSNGGLNLRPSSPRAVFGNARRDCSKFLNNRGQGAEASDSKDGMTGHQSAVNLRRNQSGLGSEDQRTSDVKSAPFGTAARDTSEFIVRAGDGMIRSCQSPERKVKVSGGVIGSAPRFRAGSPLGLPTSATPGPQSYRPSPAFCSNFGR